jgi:hypothetical protein
MGAQMERDDNGNRRITKTKLFVAIVLVIAAIVPMTFVFATTTTATTQAGQKIAETQSVATQFIDEEDRDVNGIEFTPRWGPITTIAPDAITVLFADCLDGEFAVSGMNIFETTDVIASQSFPIGLPDPADRMTWLIVAQNTASQPRSASAGVICADENEGANEAEQDIDLTTKTTINNIVKNVIKVQNNQIVNLNEVINIRQEIVQNAIQVLQITGNNNVVNQVIQQSANQIASANTTNPTQIEQIIDQNAQQEGVTPPGTTLSQIIEQEAQQQANVTTGGGGGTTIDQFLGQNASQFGNITGGGGGTIDQGITQQGEQGTNITEQPSQQQGPTDLQQFLDQQAQQQAQIQEQEQNRSAIEQQIEQQGEQQAQIGGNDTATAD